MITDINLRSRIGPVIRRQNLNDYWSEYFTFQRSAPNLHEITEKELLKELEQALKMQSPFLDSQQAISRVLTKLGSKHNFHRQFTELFPDFQSVQILGMQLYRIVLEHEQFWVYSPIQHAGHMFFHATFLYQWEIQNTKSYAINDYPTGSLRPTSIAADAAMLEA